jgi:hypothetical protein
MKALVLSALLIFEILARRQDFQATPVFSFWSRLFARHGDFPELKLPGRRDIRAPRVSGASDSVCSRFAFDFVFSVPSRLCGECSFGCGFAALCSSVANWFLPIWAKPFPPTLKL